jgi:hypothetical protein
MVPVRFIMVIKLIWLYTYQTAEIILVYLFLFQPCSSDTKFKTFFLTFACGLSQDETQRRTIHV